MAILNFSVERCCEVFSSPVFHEDSKSGLRIGRRLLEHGLIVCEKSPILLRQIPIFKNICQFITFLYVGRLKYANMSLYVGTAKASISALHA
jgi:hypothetical protein